MISLDFGPSKKELARRAERFSKLMLRIDRECAREHGRRRKSMMRRGHRKHRRRRRY